MSIVEQRSPYFFSQYSKNKLIRDLIEGLDALRNVNQSETSTSFDAGESYYLPKFPSEPDHIYENRVRRSYLVNFFKRAIQTDSGKILSAPLSIKINDLDSIPEEYERWFDNVDLDGTPIDVLASDQLQAGLSKGVTLAYVDYIEDSSTPFIVPIDIDNVLSFKTDKRTGKLTFLRWSASNVEDSDEESVDINTTNVIFEIEPTRWAMYDDDGGDEPVQSGEIRRFKDGEKRIKDEIPVSIFYTNKKRTLLAESPYIDLAELTIEHFQVSSDVKNNLFFALTPMLFGKGIPENSNVQSLAAWQFIAVDEGSPNADISWVQADASAVEQARRTIEDIERRISLFGVDLAGIRPSGNRTATQSAINSAGSNAALETFSKGLSEHVERLIEMMGSYTTSAVSAAVDITPDFSVNNNNDNVKNALEAYKEKAISGQTLTEVMVNNNVLPKGYSYEEDLNRINEKNALDDM